MPEPAHALCTAIRAGDAEAVGALLRDSPELTNRLNDPLPGAAFGGTALLAAVEQGHLAIVDLLLAAGADINARSHWWAGSFGVLDGAPPDLAAHLIERGATIDAHAAARLGMVERLQAIVEGDPAAVRARGGDGQTPLHFASSITIADYLLGHGAEVDATDVDHESTPAQWMLGRVDDRESAPTRHHIARFLVSRGCRTDILMAAALGDCDLVRKHLDADPAALRTTVSEQWFPKRDPRAAGTIYIWTLGANRTAHAVARHFRHDDVFALLMDRSPLALRLASSCELGDEAEALSLLAAHPDLARTLPPEDQRRLADAAQDSNIAGVRLMLQAGWPVDARGQHGSTALHWAAFHGHAALARDILGRHPPLEALSSEFKGTPLQWALYGSRHGWHRRTGDYAGTVEALLEAGAAPPTDAGEATEPVQEVLRRWSDRSAP